MDTGVYMANQMDDLISASEYQYDEFCNQLDSDIADYIKKCGYTWTVDEIIKQYREKYGKYYVSHTCKEIIMKFEDRLKRVMKSKGASNDL